MTGRTNAEATSIISIWRDKKLKTVYVLAQIYQVHIAQHSCSLFPRAWFLSLLADELSAGSNGVRVRRFRIEPRQTIVRKPITAIAARGNKVRSGSEVPSQDERTLLKPIQARVRISREEPREEEPRTLLHNPIYNGEHSKYYREAG